jgi:hypothetical protein
MNGVQTPNPSPAVQRVPGLFACMQTLACDGRGREEGGRGGWRPDLLVEGSKESETAGSPSVCVGGGEGSA